MRRERTTCRRRAMNHEGYFGWLVRTQLSNGSWNAGACLDNADPPACAPFDLATYWDQNINNAWGP